MSFFKNWFKRPEKFMAPRSIYDAPSYLDGFARAARFTQSLGFEARSLLLSDTQVNVLDRGGDFVDAVYASANVADRTKAAGQCLKWCHYLQPYFERQLGRRVMLTTGQLWNKEACVFGPRHEDFMRWVKSGIQLDDFDGGNGVKLHAWLTVETGEIIEPTLLSTLGAFGHESYRRYLGATVWGRDPNVLNGHRYVPLVIGSEIVEQISKRSFVPLLASGPGELALQAFAVFEKM